MRSYSSGAQQHLQRCGGRDWRRHLRRWRADPAGALFQRTAGRQPAQGSETGGERREAEGAETSEKETVCVERKDSEMGADGAVSGTRESDVGDGAGAETEGLRAAGSDGDETAEADTQESSAAPEMSVEDEGTVSDSELCDGGEAGSDGVHTAGDEPDCVMPQPGVDLTTDPVSVAQNTALSLTAGPGPPPPAPGQRITPTAPSLWRAPSGRWCRRVVTPAGGAAVRPPGSLERLWNTRGL